METSQQLKMFALKNADWPLRLALGSAFMYHGTRKFPLLDLFSEILSLPVATIVLIAIAESFGGLLIIVGRWLPGVVTRLGGALIFPIMLGAVHLHWGQWSFAPTESHPYGGIEFPFTMLMLSTYFIVAGNLRIAEPAHYQRKRKSN